MNDYDIIEVYSNTEKNVVKYVHANGAESTMKTASTCTNVSSESDNKAVLFLSVSAGCKQGCKFCHLTAKKFKHYPISTDTIIKSAIEVIKLSAKQIKGRYLKISFMGMGDVFCANVVMSEVAKKVFLYAYKKKMIKGIDGVDIGTSYPQVDTESSYEEIQKLSEVLSYLDMPLNPLHWSASSNTSRTPVRLFISLHSTSDEVRKNLMPNTSEITKIFDEIRTLSNDVIFHYILFDGINDSADDIEALVSLFSYAPFNSYELRLLRFNHLDKIQLKESLVVEDAIEKLLNSPLKFKYQLSAGSDVYASCGQFLCRAPF